MRRFFGYLSAALAALFGAQAVVPAPAAAETLTLPAGTDAENMLVLDLKDGQVLIELYPQDAPNSVARVKELVRKGFYDGLTFHRVIDGFMAQTGDPKGDGTGGSGQPLKAEFNDRMHLRGAVSMARAEDPDSADSQFFIVFRPSFNLDHKYTVIGRVVSGMEAVDRIKRGEGPEFIASGQPDRIVRLRVAADVAGVTVVAAPEPAAPAAETGPVAAPESAPAPQP